MKGKELAILFFIIAVLVFYIYSQKNEKTHYELPVLQKVEEGSISKIAVRKKDSEITLEKDNGTWRVGKQKYPADTAGVENMLKDISGLTLTALASESKNYSLYELDEDHVIEVDAYENGTRVRRIRVGKTASSYRHTFVMVDDDPRVFHAAGNLRSAFDRNVPDLRDKTVMAFKDDITEVSLKKGKEELRLLRAAPVSEEVSGKGGEEAAPGKEGPKWTTAGGEPVNDGEVEGIITTLSHFLCDAFIGNKTKDDFTSPVFTATLKGAGTYRISFFKEEGNQYPGVSSESDYPFLVSEWKAKKIMKDFSSLHGGGG
jgi:hypothetical protein